jgi:hypothetical protein
MQAQSLNFPTGVPHRQVKGHQRERDLTPRLDTLKEFYQGKARDQLTSTQRRDLQSLEHDQARLKELQGELKAAAAWVSSGEATENVLSWIREVSQEKQAAETRTEEILKRHEPEAPVEPFMLWKSGDQIHVHLEYEEKNVSKELRDGGVSALTYSVSTELGVDDLRVQAVPKGEGASLSYGKVRVSTQAEQWRGEEFTLGEESGDYTQVEYNPLGRGSDDFYPSLNGDVARWSNIDRAFAAQMMKDLGVSWPVPVED